MGDAHSDILHIELVRNRLFQEQSARDFHIDTNVLASGNVSLHSMDDTRTLPFLVGTTRIGGDGSTVLLIL